MNSFGSTNGMARKKCRYLNTRPDLSLSILVNINLAPQKSSLLSTSLCIICEYVNVNFVLKFFYYYEQCEIFRHGIRLLFEINVILFLDKSKTLNNYCRKIAVFFSMYSLVGRFSLQSGLFDTGSSQGRNHPLRMCGTPTGTSGL